MENPLKAKTSVQKVNFVQLETNRIRKNNLFFNSFTVVGACIGESTMRSFWHSMATNWSIMAARAQMELVKLEEFNLKGMKSTEY